MKPKQNNLDDLLDRHLALFKASSRKQPDAERESVLNWLQSQAEFFAPEEEPGKPRNLWQRHLIAAAALLALAFLTIVGLRTFRLDVAATVEAADGALMRVTGEQTRNITLGDTIQAGEILRSAATSAGVRMTDGSHVEMRSETEFAFERADDGIRIRLMRGGLIINAAKQRAGHLYVQTKDVTVSVVGTVFLVNAEEQGSRVAVIEGEVRVQQGATQKSLGPGQEVVTNPKMIAAPVIQEISWSRNAAAHLALLQQSAALLQPTTVLPPPPPPQNPAEGRDAFEVISIRPASGPGGGGLRSGGPRGGGGGGGRGGPILVSPCGGMLQVDPSRFVAANITVYRLIALAYGKNCPTLSSTEPDLISGAPVWAKSEAFDIQAVIPAGSPSYTRSQLIDGNAPKLQMMIQTMLADRFKLTLRREMKEMPVYELVVLKDVKGRLSENQTAADATPGSPGMAGGGVSFRIDPPNGLVMLTGNATPIAGLLNLFQGQVGRPIIDKTELKGRLYDIPETTANVGAFEIGGPSVWPDIAVKLLPQLGLKLEPATGLVEVLVIDRVEKPSEN